MNRRTQTSQQTPAIMTIKQAGFTLIELMVAVVLSSVIVIAIAIFVSQIAGKSGDMYQQQVQRDQLHTAIELLRNDVETAGLGLPFDLMTQGVEVQQTKAAMIRDVIRFSIQDINRKTEGVDSYDELFLGGVGMWLNNSTGKSSMVTHAQNVMSSQTQATPKVLRPDGPNVPYDLADVTETADYNYLYPLTISVGKTPRELASFVSPNEGFRLYTKLAPVSRFEPAMAPAAGGGSIRMFVEPTPIIDGENTPDRAPELGDYIFFTRPVPTGPAKTVDPWAIQVARWYLQREDAEAGTLFRETIIDPRATSYTALPAVPMLRNVVDFQVEFLVFPCAADTPTWGQHLINFPDGQPMETAATGEFSGNPLWAMNGNSYQPGSNIFHLSDRFMAMRERLMAIRIHLLVREPINDATDLQVLPVADQSALVADHNNINLQTSDFVYKYYTHVFDPINLRIKTSSSGQEIYPMVRSLGTNIRTQAEGQAYCKGRAGAEGATN